jgi:hypothetical protein
LNRRQFLKSLGLLGLLGTTVKTFTGCQSPLVPPNISNQLPIVDHWVGYDPTLPHRIRDNAPVLPPPPAPDETQDVVIIGAGISGLTAAFKLKDTDRLLVLEAQTSAGGNAKQGEYKGIAYALGSAYFVDTEAPFDQFYSDVGVPLTPLRSPEDWLMETPGKMAPLEHGQLSLALERLQAHLSDLAKRNALPIFPISKASTDMLALDRMSLQQYLRNYHFEQPLLEWVDVYCRSSLGCGVKEASAYVGLNFLSELTANIYALPGGNAGIVQRLLAHVGAERVRLGAATYKVQPVADGVLTTYLYNGQARTVKSKTVIMALPYMMANRLLTHTPAGLGTLPYGAYVVANLCFDEKVLHSGYDTWVTHNPGFTDIVDATYCLPVNAPVTGQVLTVYAPMRQLSARYQLLTSSPQAIALPLLKAIAQDFPQLPLHKVKQVVMTRYGHQLLASRVGIIHHVRGLPAPTDRVVFAHSDGQGASSVESAVLQGLQAASICKTYLPSRSVR